MYANLTKKTERHMVVVEYGKGGMRSDVSTASPRLPCQTARSRFWSLVLVSHKLLSILTRSKSDFFVVQCFYFQIKFI